MKFSIRDLLLVTVIYALALGWWIDRIGRMEVKRRTEAEIEKAEKVQSDLHRAEKQLSIAHEGLEAQKRTIEYLKSRLPNSSAPAANTHKD